MFKLLIVTIIVLSSFSTSASESLLPDSFIGRWSPTLEECKKDPIVGDDYPDLITLTKSKLQGYESQSRIEKVIVKSSNQIIISGTRFVEGETLKFNYQLTLSNKQNTLMIKYSPELEEIKYLRCP